jgi:hypothetical protein
LLAGFINCAVKSGIIRPRFNSFESSSVGTIGIEVLAVEAGNDQKRLGARYFAKLYRNCFS